MQDRRSASKWLPAFRLSALNEPRLVRSRMARQFDAVLTLSHTQVVERGQGSSRPDAVPGRNPPTNAVVADRGGTGDDDVSSAVAVHLSDRVGQRRVVELGLTALPADDDLHQKRPPRSG